MFSILGPPELIEPLEAAGRVLCQLRGLDPDERVGVGHPKGYAVALYAPQWKVAASEILRHRQIETAILDTGLAPISCRRTRIDIEDLQTEFTRPKVLVPDEAPQDDE